MKRKKFMMQGVDCDYFYIIKLPRCYKGCSSPALNLYSPDFINDYNEI